MEDYGGGVVGDGRQHQQSDRRGRRERSGFLVGAPGPISWTTEETPGATAFLFLVGRTGRLAELLIQRALRSHQLDSSQLSVLIALTSAGHDGAMSHGALASLLAQTPSGTTRTVKRLERAELVAREPDPADGRSFLLRITPAGTRLMGAAMTDLLAQFEVQLDQGSPLDLTGLVGTLQQVTDVFEHQPDRTPLEVAGVACEPKDTPAPETTGPHGADDDEPVGARIRRRRTELGLSLVELAGTVGIGAPHLSKIERGLEQPSETVLANVATALAIDADELMLGAGLVPRWMIEALAADPARASATLRRWG